MMVAIFGDNPECLIVEVEVSQVSALPRGKIKLVGRTGGGRECQVELTDVEVFRVRCRSLQEPKA